VERLYEWLQEAHGIKVAEMAAVPRI
jgi:hypothetical protein